MDLQKQKAAEAAVDLVQDGMLLGIGTGSTMAFAIRALGRRVREGLSIQGLPTSEQTQKLAQEEGIPLVDFSQVTHLDMVIDGADEVDLNFDLIKGGGGALFREKVVASRAKEVVIIVDSSKKVPVLGQFPLPVEVGPFGWQTVASEISKLGVTPVLRQKDGRPFETDNHNYILDCSFETISDAASLEQHLNQIPGVVINGLFVGMTTKVILGTDQGIEILEKIACPSH